MKRAPRLSGIAAICGMTVAFVAFTATTLAQSTHEVAIDDDRFSPATIEIEVGETVVWTNRGREVHTTTSDGAWDSGDIRPGAEFSFTFTRAGTYDYVCQYHPEMRGRVVVGGSAPSPRPSSPPVPSSAVPSPSPAGNLLVVGGLTLLAAALILPIAARLGRRRRR